MYKTQFTPPQGEVGPARVLRGVLTDVEQLDEVVNPQDGDAYLVGRFLRVYNQGIWVNLGGLTGQMQVYFVKLVQEVHGEYTIPEALWEYYRDLATLHEVNSDELTSILDYLKRTYFPELSYNQIRKRVFAALGYRSTGLADAMRVRYTQAHAFNELHYPNMWDQFTEGYEQSVFGSDFYGHKKYIIPYLEMLYEPHLILFQEKGEVVLDFLQKDSSSFDNERFLQGFYLYLDLAQDKTASLDMVKDWAMLFSEVVDVSYTDALSMASIALGFKAWTRARAAVVEGSITNQRYQWAYA